MRKYLTSYLILLGALLLNSNVLAADYKEYARQMRNAVWNWDMEVFKNYSVPEKYKNESAVILAHHQQIEATSKNWSKMFSLLLKDFGRGMYYTNIDRKMIKLNNQKALDEYSELSFKEEASMGYFNSDKLKIVLGARIIKPNGTIQEVDIDEDAVAITEGKKDKDAFKKIAIRGLEVGDILDYFYSEEMDLETLNVSPQIFTFFNKYPTLSYSIECLLGPKLTVEYRSVNGAPEFEESIDNDNNVMLKASRKNLDVIEDLDNIRWLSLSRDFPMIRLLILNNLSKVIDKSANARKSGVYKNVSYAEILKDKKCSFAAWSNKMFWMNDIYKKANKIIVNYKEKNTSVSNENLALYIYDALRFYWPYGMVDYPSEKFLLALEKILKENNIECKICFTTGRAGVPKENVVEENDLTVFLSANHNKQLFYFPNGYRAAAEPLSIFEGEIASAVSVVKYKANSPIGIEGITSEFEIPKSSFKDNKSVIKSEITFSEKNLLDLKIKRAVTCSGEMKSDYIDALALYEDWDKQMRTRLMIETDFLEDMQTDKNSRKYIDKYKTIFEDKRRELRETMKGEFKEYHSSNSGELIDYKIKNIGVNINEPTFAFETEYTIDGLVKKAGDNLLLAAGKLIGTQWVPTEKERNRSCDAYISSAMSIDHEIMIQIPEHYTVVGIENLNKSIDNEYSRFTSTAVAFGNTLRITASKVYKQNFVPQNSWNNLLEMIDVTNNFYSQSVMLKHD